VHIFFIQKKHLVVCSGPIPPCYQTIEDAINAANTGDIISISPGNYSENATTIDIAKQISLEVAGTGDVVISMLDGSTT